MKIAALKQNEMATIVHLQLERRKMYSMMLRNIYEQNYLLDEGCLVSHILEYLTSLNKYCPKYHLIGDALSLVFNKN